MKNLGKIVIVSIFVIAVVAGYFSYRNTHPPVSAEPAPQTK